MSAPPFVKYPRTAHVRGSRHGRGDDLATVSLFDLEGRHLVLEEKLDGANCALRFSSTGELFVQSRGHYLVGGPRERHFTQLKAWTAAHHDALWSVLGKRYVLFGEWLAAKHTMYYDDLPHYFLAFDVYDTERYLWLDTPTRRELLRGAPVVGVPVIATGILVPNASRVQSQDVFGPLVQRSLYASTGWRASLQAAAHEAGQDIERVWRETSPSSLAEGLYIKIERGGETVGRAKWVREGFLDALVGEDEGGTHWLDRPHLASGLRTGVDLYAATLTAASTQLRDGQVA